MNAVHKKGETLQQQSKHLLSDLPHQNAVREGPIHQQHKKILQGLMYLYNLCIFNVSNLLS